MNHFAKLQKKIITNPYSGKIIKNATLTSETLKELIKNFFPEKSTKKLNNIL